MVPLIDRRVFSGYNIQDLRFNNEVQIHCVIKQQGGHLSVKECTGGTAHRRRNDVLRLQHKGATSKMLV